MPESELTFDNVREELLSAFPDLLERYWRKFGSSYDLEKGTRDETPGAYLLYEDVVKKLLFELLDGASDNALLTRLFVFFEKMANSPDPNVSRDLLGIAILEPLVFRRESLQQAWKFMGPKMKEFARLEAVQQGRPENLPPHS